jgi:hypothetical protein
MAAREFVHNKKARTVVRNFIKHECFSGRTLVCGERDFGVYRPLMEEGTSNCKGGHVERC